MRSARTATSTRPPRMTTASSGASRAALTAVANRPAAGGRANGLSPAMVAMPLPRQPDARIDDRVGDVDHEVDADDHEAGHDDHALDEREVALEDALVEQPADARPREDHLDDDRGVDHDHQVDAGQREDRDERVLERVQRDDDD